jgi:hypothetical protein
MSVQPSALRVNGNVLYLFRLMLMIPAKRSRLFMSGLDSFEGNDAEEFFNTDRFLLTALASQETPFTKYRRYGEKAVVTADSRYQLFKPVDVAHYAIAVPNFSTVTDAAGKQSVQPVTVEDELLFWQCSKTTSVRRDAPLHVIQIEQLYNATLPGGYFAAILPKSWCGDRMDFMRWFANHAGSVAKIKLPYGTVTTADGKPLGDWLLHIWCRPTSKDGNDKEKKAFAKFRYAEMRHPTFIQRVKDLHDDVDRLAKLFRKHDWYQYHVKQWNEARKDTHSYDVEYGVNCASAAEIQSPDKTTIFKPGPTTMLQAKIVGTTNEMLGDVKAVQIKPGRRIKLQAFSRSTYAALADIVETAGYDNNPKDGVNTSRFVTLLRNSYSQVQEELLRTLLESGLQPYMLQRDVSKVATQARWLSRQLTPIERYIRIKTDAEDGNAVVWEKLYEDVGMDASQRQNMDIWRNRMKAMNMAKIATDTIQHSSGLAFEFQGTDLCVLACKDGILNGSAMGMGKTLESLLEFLLRTKKKVLIVCPSKLIQEWKNEIERNLTIYARRQRLNWRNKLIDVSYQIIRYAANLKAENMKAINIISYERLWARPKDAMFFVCPACKDVVCSVKMFPQQVCPKCTPKAHAEWKKYTKENKLRKHVTCVNEQGKTIKLHIRVWKGGRIDINKLEKFLASHPNINATVHDNWKLVDPRPKRPRPQYMNKSEKHFEKVSVRFSDKHYDVKIVDGKEQRIPKPQHIKRGLHLRWTFSHLLRWRFNMVMCDEALYIKSEDANRTLALWKITAQVRRVLTGTPIRGKPKNILNLLNWATKRPVYPDYRTLARGKAIKGDKAQRSEAGSGPHIFLRKFATYVTVKRDGNAVKQLLPKLGNAELFQTEIASIMLRHTKNEPIVVKDIPLKKKILTPVPLEMDEQHKIYYKKWLDKFSEWWVEKRKNIDKKEVGKGGREPLIVKLTYLINASTVPHSMYDGLMEKARKNKLAGVDDDDFLKWAKSIGKYEGPLTAKQLYMLKSVAHAKAVGDKIIVFSWRRKNLELGKMWADKNNVLSLIIDSKVTTTLRADGTSARGDAISAFRNQPYNCLWAGLTAMSEGVNLPEANRGVIIDYSWEPSEYKQAIGRMDRLQQTKTIHIDMLRHHGSIDDFMYLTNELKDGSAGEGIDYMEYDLKTEAIPDVHQYADALVDGTETKLKAKMELAVDAMRKRKEEEGET